MKIIFTTVGLLFLATVVAQEENGDNQFVLTGKVSGQNSGIVSLTYFNKTGDKITDTCFLEDGKFTFNGDIPNPIPVTFRGAVESIADDDPNCAQFYIAPGTMNLLLEKDHFKSFSLKGSPTQAEKDTLNQMIRQLNLKSPHYLDSLVNTVSYFIRTHPDSYVSAFELLPIMSLIKTDTALNLYNRMDVPVRESYYGKEVLKKLQTVASASEGKAASPFSAPDINGKEISLTGFRGKYVLLDFWASWCIPCRKENPEMIKMYQKYHSKGLEIIGISSDDDRDSWLAAISNDGTDIWNHVLGYPEKDGDTPDEESIGRQYGVLSLPTKILIDPEGNIIQRFSFAQNNPTLEQVLELIFEK